MLSSFAGYIEIAQKVGSKEYLGGRCGCINNPSTVLTNSI